MQLSRTGLLVRQAWLDVPFHYPRIRLDEFCIMPNHFHGILCLSDPLPGEKAHPDLPEVMRAFKSFSARRINAFRQMPGVPVWQRNYYERIIRGDEELNRIRQYIQENPLKWDEDEENRTGRDGWV